MAVVIRIWINTVNIELFKIDFKITSNENTVDLIGISPQHFNFSLHFS